MLSLQAVRSALAGLGMLKYFPADEMAQSAIGKLLVQICEDEAKLEWLVGRTLALCNQWPGPLEIRAIYCAKYKPADGIEADSTVYIDGIPSEAITRPALPAPRARQVTIDTELQELIEQVAESRRLGSPNAKTA